MQPSRSASAVEAMAGAGDRCAAAATGLPIAPLGVVVTTALEERMWRRDAPAGEVLTVVTGADPERARQGVERLIGNGVGGLLSFGLAAALAPAVAPGDVVVADAVVPPSGGAIRCDPGWQQALITHLRNGGIRATQARIAGAAEVPLLPHERARLFKATFAAALDTDSHLVAQAAHAAGLPLLVVRVVADAAHCAGPAGAGIGSAGGSVGRAVISRLMARPWEIGVAWRLMQNARQALAALERVRQLVPGAVSPDAA
jgi:adenosylhomocysteine nucleosidase